MQNLYDYDYKKFAILYVDDEEKSLKYFARAFQDQFRILTAVSAAEGLAILEKNVTEIGLLMTDQRMPAEKGVWLLERARQLEPRIIRILATAYSDMEAAIDAVNNGAIYKYVTKPWDPPQLETTLKRGLEFFIVQHQRDSLLKEKMSVLRNMMIGDRIISLGLLAAGMSHHIRNSLVAVKTFLDLTPKKLEEEKLDINSLRNPDFWKEYYQNVQGQIERINNLLKDLWTASEKPTFTFSDEVDLCAMIQETIDHLKPSLEARKLKVRNDVPPNLPRLVADKPMFYRLFELLLKDEIVSLPEGCEIVISGETQTDTRRGSQVCLQIRDNGPGLPQEALRLLFDPFAVRTDNPLEYGINLMACYFIVHHHGGKIEAASEADRGTTFTLRLPVNPNQSPIVTENSEFLQKAVLDDALWEKLMASH